MGWRDKRAFAARQKVGDVEIKWNLELLGVPIPGGASFD